MREIRLYGSEGGEAFNPLSLPLSLRFTRNPEGRSLRGRRKREELFADKL